MPFKIAIDCDDCICATNEDVKNWHNKTYNTNWCINDFHYYHYWKNVGWGTPQETFEKVTKYYNNENGGLELTSPVEGAKEGLKILKDLGFELVIVTARNENQRTMTKKWLDHHFDGLFDKLYFTGQFTSNGDLEADNEGVPIKKDDRSLTHLTKADIIDKIDAKLLVDDSIENAFNCASHKRQCGSLKGKPIHTLLFSPFPPDDKIPIWHYPWNVEISKQESEDDYLSYSQRIDKGLSTGENRKPTELLPDIERVKSWNHIVERIIEIDSYSHSSQPSIINTLTDKQNLNSVNVQA